MVVKHSIHQVVWQGKMESYHRITEWLGLEGTSRVIKLQPPPHHREGCQPPHLILVVKLMGMPREPKISTRVAKDVFPQ